MMYLMADRRLFRTISHRSEVLSDQPWDTIAPLRPELISPGRPWPSNGELFEGTLRLRYRLAKRREVTTGVVHADRGGKTLDQRELGCGQKRRPAVGKTKGGQGTEPMVVADGRGIPVVCHLCLASPAEVTLVEARLA